jgi:hypothetical protein
VAAGAAANSHRGRQPTAGSLQPDPRPPPLMASAYDRP